MNTADYLTLANILVAFLGVMFAILAFFEWRSLRTLRQNMESLRSEIHAEVRAENTKLMQAAHKVMASYAVQDVEARIALLESALASCPHAFNGYNSLGYALWEKGAHAEAIDAFREAIAHFPDEKAGYCDVAFAYYAQGHETLAEKFFLKAIHVDPSAKDDIAKDTRLSESFRQDFM